MARTVDVAGHATKRTLILDVAQELVFTRGYDQMTIQDLIRETGLSRGALYHYYSTKSAVLESLVERMQSQAETPLREIATASDRTAPEKLRAYFQQIDQARQNQQSLLDQLVRVWYTDDNALLRQKVDAATLIRRAPLLALIVEQGTREGVFAVTHPDLAGEAVVVLAMGLNDAIARHLLSQPPPRTTSSSARDILRIYGGYAEAIERVVGSAGPILERPVHKDVTHWLNGRRSGSRGPASLKRRITS